MLACVVLNDTLIIMNDTEMKAIVYTKYGLPSEVLELKEVEIPTPKDNEVLVKIYAASISWADNAVVRSKPFIVRARNCWTRI